MAYYLVCATPSGDMEELRMRLDAGQISALQPFGPELYRALDMARFDPESGDALWEEVDHCEPPLAEEREAVLDEYFTDIRVEEVEEGEGWGRIDHLPGLWIALTQ